MIAAFLRLPLSPNHKCSSFNQSVSVCAKRLRRSDTIFLRGKWSTYLSMKKVSSYFDLISNDKNGTQTVNGYLNVKPKLFLGANKVSLDWAFGYLRCLGKTQNVTAEKFKRCERWVGHDQEARVGFKKECCLSEFEFWEEYRGGGADVGQP